MKKRSLRQLVDANPSAHYFVHGLRNGFSLKYPSGDHWARQESEHLLHLYGRTWRLARRRRTDLESVHTFVMFLGHQFSGHSLVGSLLDAHPNVIISHELHVLPLVASGFSARQVQALCLENSERHARAGRGESGYSYEVPGQWQGRAQQLLVVGDKDARRDTRVLHRYPALLDLILDRFSAFDLRLIHVTRNPFDNIARLIDRDRELRGAEFKGAAKEYFEMTDAIKRAASTVGPKLIHLRYEDIVLDSDRELTRLCSELSVAPDPSWLQACGALLSPSPRLSRHRHPWTDQQIEEVSENIRQYSFLSSYSWDEPTAAQDAPANGAPR